MIMENPSMKVPSARYSPRMQAMIAQGGSGSPPMKAAIAWGTLIEVSR